MQRKTQEPAYWSEEFAVGSDDLQYLSTLLIEDELPRSVEELARALVLYRCRQEDAAIQRAVSKGTPYRPSSSYGVGEQVVFPLFDYRVGEVTGVRPGRNAEHGPFKVIQVDFGSGDRREFAAELQGEHVLNRDVQPSVIQSGDGATPEELAAQFTPMVARTLLERLESDQRFVRLAGKWFRRDLLVELHIGHLNLAEAVLDVAGGGPLPTEALLSDLGLPDEVSHQLRIFSLNYALQEDDRFDEVGPAGEVLWFLGRLEPDGVRTTPPYLEYEPIEYERDLLTSEMLSLEQDLDDEWSLLEAPAEVPDSVTVVLTYPHWRSGTLPLSSQLARIFPTGRTARIRFMFVDGDTGVRMPGWVVRQGRYVFGLGDWYKKNDVPVGAYFELRRTDEAGLIEIRRRGRRPRREWVRVALPVEGRLTFEVRKTLITCDYDELMIVEEDDPRAIDVIRSRVRRTRMSVGQLVADVFPELAKLSPQGTVHAATLYSAINLVRRTPPAPVIAELVMAGRYAPMGDNYWVLRPDSGVA